jgi:ketol-acid reductoisomerase
VGGSCGGKEGGVKKTVYASSSPEYGDTPALPKVFTSDIKELIQDHLETLPGGELLSR